MNGRTFMWAGILSTITTILAARASAQEENPPHADDRYRLTGCAESEDDCRIQCLEDGHYFILSSPDSCAELFQGGKVFCFCLIKRLPAPPRAKTPPPIL